MNTWLGRMDGDLLGIVYVSIMGVRISTDVGERRARDVYWAGEQKRSEGREHDVQELLLRTW